MMMMNTKLRVVLIN